MKTKIMVPALLAAVLVTGCGQPKPTDLVSGIQGSAYTKNGDLYAEVDAQLNTATYNVASFALPIIDPNNSAIQYGSISIVPNLGGTGGELKIAINVSQAAKINTSNDGSLPNGTAFPINIGKNSIVSIPIGNGGAKLYLVVGPNTVLVGAAIPFSALNDVGRYVPGVDIFGALNAGKITAYIGGFGGSAPNTTGLGVFADLSKVLPNPNAPIVAPAALAANSVAGVSSESSASISSAPAAVKSPLSLRAAGSARDQRRFFSHLMRVGQDNPTLDYR